MLASSLSKVAENNVLYIYVLDITEHPVTIIKCEEVAKFSFLLSDQAEKLLVDPQLINVTPEYEKLWFPTPETCPDPKSLSPLQREIFEQLLKLQKMEKLDPTGNHQDKFAFLSKFPWEKSALNDE